MTDKITLELTLQELKTIDKYVVLNDETKPLFEKIKSAYPKPKMIVENKGYFEIVSYNDSIYYYLHYPTGSHWFFKNDENLEHITDKETIELLNNAWFKDYNEVVELAKPAEEVFDRLEDKYKEAEENSASYITDDVVDRLVKEYKAQKLFNRLVDELGYDFDASNDIVDLVEDWIPEYQVAAGSQNVNTELLVDGFNDAILKMKEMLR